MFLLLLLCAINVNNVLKTLLHTNGIMYNTVTVQVFEYLRLQTAEIKQRTVLTAVYTATVALINQSSC